jgi:Do/DeqQ family serine protease
MKKYDKKSIFRFSGIGAILLITSLIVYQASCFGEKDSLIFGATDKSPLHSNDKIVKAGEVQDSFREIFKINNERVVYISTEQTVKLPSHPFFQDPFFRDFFGAPQNSQPRMQKRTGLGTGFILSEDGYICTNHHVVTGMDKVKVKIGTKHYDAKIVGSDERTDIALLKIDPDIPLKPVFLGDSDSVQVGDWAIAIGNPFGLEKTFTVGVVSATARKDLDLMGGSQAHIQTDASINPGNSGGPLLNIHGEVIGINRMIYSKTGGNMGIGFAIPINKAKEVLAQLKKYKKVKRGYLGVQIVPLTEEYASQLGLKKTEGALVGAVVKNSPAEKGGIQVGDVVLKVNKKPIKDFTDLVKEVEKTPINTTLKVLVWRRKQKVNLFITIKERP